MADNLATQLHKLQDLRDLVGEESYAQSIAKLRLQYGDTAVDALLQADRHADQSRHHVQVISGTAEIAVAGDVHGNIYTDGKRSKDAAELLRGYLERQIIRCSTVPLQGFRDQMTADDVLKIGFDQLYTQIITTQSKQSITRTIATNKLLVMLGEPGSGKSTVLRYLTIHLSRAGTEDQYTFRQLDGWDELMRMDDDDRYDPLYEMIQEEIDLRMRLLPIFLPLSPFSRKIANQTSAIDESDKLWEYIADYLEADGRFPSLANVVHEELDAAEQEARRIRIERTKVLREAERELELLDSEYNRLYAILKSTPIEDITERQKIDRILTQIQEKFITKRSEVEIRKRQEKCDPKTWRVILLLDGLDEVSTDKARQDTVRAVQAFSQAYPQCRIVVTSRIRAYEGEKRAKWQLPGWPVVTLADWTIEQMKQYISAWYAAVAYLGAMPITKRDERRAGLEQAISTREDLQRLGARPLLLTIMALIHFNDARLAENRAALYDRCLDILLGQWEIAAKDKTQFGTLMDYIGMPDADVKHLRALLGRVAFLAQSATSPGTSNSLGRAELLEMIARVLTEQKHPNPWDGAQLFLKYADERAGILQASDTGDTYVFPHQTFQEYLAGLELVSGVDFVQQVMDRRDALRWRLPIMLGISHLVSEGELAKPYQLLAELLEYEGLPLERKQRDLIFAAEIGSDVGWDSLDRGGAAFKVLRRNLAQALTQVVEGQILPAAERVHAGVLLGTLGDLRPGVCELPPASVRVIGDTFLIGESDQTKNHIDELNYHRLTLPDFEIGRFLITNAQYRLFIEEDGYNPDKPWWDADGRRLLQDGKHLPSLWNNERLGIHRLTHPVVGITWFEAVTFCRWLTQHADKNPKGYIFRLPSEAEWEYVARGTTRRLYPWGSKEPDSESANFENLYKGTTAVGCFKAGATPEGLQDLAGNTWEWTNSVYAPYPYDPHDGRERADGVSRKRIVIRGGGWNSRVISLRASGRNNVVPSYQSDSLGFRLAWDVRLESEDVHSPVIGVVPQTGMP